MTYDFFATCPLGLESVLGDELRALRVRGVRPGTGGVTFNGELRDAYRACLWSRTASRILLKLAAFDISSADDLYAAVRDIEWERHLDASRTLAVDFSGTGAGIADTRFGGVRVKDAVVDRLRDLSGERPNVKVERPDIRINTRLRNGRVTLSLDLSGEPLHRRGYRTEEAGVVAPLKENVAAGMLLLAGWRDIAAEGGALYDPMCGSGTLLIEGAWIAADIAPGTLRSYWGFEGWLGHDAELWDDLLAEADDRAEAGMEKLPSVSGSDIDRDALKVAEAEIGRAGLRGRIVVSAADAGKATPPVRVRPGLVATNPPYGERLGEREALGETYAQFGNRLREAFPGWRAVVLTSDDELASRLGAAFTARYELRNGPIEVGAYVFETTPWAPSVAKQATSARETKAARAGARVAAPVVPPAAVELGPGAEMLANRLRKNLRHLGKWARREGVTCWRVYDSDLPEYAVAIDIYDAGERRFLHMAEYEAPATVDSQAAERRLAEAIAVAPEVLGADAGDLVVKRRRRQRGTEQYERTGEREFVEVAEGGLRFLVDLRGQLDTGLFLDHRVTRGIIRDLASGTRFLNLFSYTATASVYAAAGGAVSTTSVDMSRTYTEWAGRNLALNGFEGPAHQLLAADVLDWLATLGEKPQADRPVFDLVFCDPPTFSNSKRMDRPFEVQRDHPWLLETVGKLLAPGGTVVFSNNFRRFSLDRGALPSFEAEDVTARTIPQDFARNPRIHNCWILRKR